MDKFRSKFDGRTAGDWMAQAEQFERMAKRFKSNAELSESFAKLAEDARDRATQHHP